MGVWSFILVPAVLSCQVFIRKFLNNFVYSWINTRLEYGTETAFQFIFCGSGHFIWRFVYMPFSNEFYDRGTFFMASGGA